MVVSDDVELRPAAAADAEPIAAIYNEGIEDRLATFETRPRCEDDARAWLGERLPFVVTERDGRVVGFARLSAYSDRCVYAGVGEHGVYVARGARGLGLGRRLLDALADAAEAAGYYKLTSRIFADNDASRAVHRAAGFDEVGVQRRHGRLDRRWKDCVVVERLLGPAVDARPVPRRPGARVRSMDDAAKELAGLNEAAYRKVNEAIEAGARPTSGERRLAVRCECGSVGCNALLEVSVAEYEAVRASPRRFLLLEGHDSPEVERVVERHERYVVVEKHDEAATVAEETDPRR